MEIINKEKLINKEMTEVVSSPFCNKKYLTIALFKVDAESNEENILGCLSMTSNMEYYDFSSMVAKLSNTKSSFGLNDYRYYVMNEQIGIPTYHNVKYTDVPFQVKPIFELAKLL